MYDMKNILEYLENSQRLFNDNIFIGEENASVTYGDFHSDVRHIASALYSCGVYSKPAAVLTGKNARCLSLAFGTVAAGGYYTILDNKSPVDRLQKILSQLEPALLLTDEENLQLALSLGFDGAIVLYDEAVRAEVDLQALESVRERQVDTDILYVLFTSGSTGTPKGVVLTHKAVIEYTSWVTKEFSFDSSTVFGSQSPFYFSMSVTDIFSSIACGARLEIIPRPLFSFPAELINYLNDRKVNTLYWVPTALSIVANLKTFESVKPITLKNVLFAGEVMPVKQLNYWMDNLPYICYANLFGPTETTDICTFYRLDRRFENSERIPIGRHCDNCAVMIIDDEGRLSDEGELYVRGSFLANGYYNDMKKTGEAFVQNPLQKLYPELCYRTGDLVRLNERGEIEYISRRDFQIKHMGYRIEPGEIESCLSACESVRSCACLYDSEKDEVVLAYEGKKSTLNELTELSESKLPYYMRPNAYFRVSNMPVNANGKLDRAALMKLYRA